MNLFSTLIGAAVTAALSFITWYLKRIVSKMNTRDKVDLVTLRGMLYLEHDILMRKEMTVQELHDYEELYDVYHSIGGNGTATVLFEEVKKHYEDRCKHTADN